LSAAVFMVAANAGFICIEMQSKANIRLIQIAGRNDRFMFIPFAYFQGEFQRPPCWEGRLPRGSLRISRCTKNGAGAMQGWKNAGSPAASPSF
jgi:hypothetical protein